jgi:DNA-binding MarR family transcriptional regulator
MKVLHNESNMKTQTENETAAVIMDVVPLIHARIRSEMRSYRMPGLSIPQFRALIYLFRHENASLSELAEHLNLKLPSTSKLIDALVERKLVMRNDSPDDRRRVSLKLSGAGLKELTKTRNSAGARIADILSALTLEQRYALTSALTMIRPLFLNQTGSSAKSGAQQ